MFLDVCKKNFHISHLRISKKVKRVLWEIFDILFPYEDEDVGRFSNLRFSIPLNLCCFHFRFFFLIKSQNFHDKISTNQKHELVIRNCQLNCMHRQNQNNFSDLDGGFPWERCEVIRVYIIQSKRKLENIVGFDFLILIYFLKCD